MELSMWLTVYPLCALIALVMYEHVGRINKYKYRPSIFLNWVARVAQSCFRNLGKFFAILSSFYELINFHELKQTLEDLCNPIIELVRSPFYIIVGYVKQMSVYDHPYLIIIGSVTIVSSILLSGVTYILYDDTYYTIPYVYVYVSLGIVTPIFVAVVSSSYSEHCEREEKRKQNLKTQ